ncbi:unnamed protein product [Brachionus calyciflorus]|uniref:Uncharacterized protein n=1 Tax=Brachionus calyciflorus TaxID=104777 RepID=A0A813R3K0_9BILA|nr:unnamed protein product [Brachionus calyciflorus]
MNQNVTDSIKIYFSLREITTELQDITNVFWLPSICIFGMFTSALNITVTFSKDLNKNPYKVILVDSIGDFLFLMVQFPLFIIRCGAICPWGHSYVAKLFEIYVYLFCGYVIVCFRVLVDISVSFNRLLILLNIGQNSKEINFYFKALIFLVIAILLNFPNFALSKQVIQAGRFYPMLNSSNYEIIYDKGLRNSFKVQWIQITLSCISVVKDPVFFTIFCGINIAIAVKFRQHMTRKSAMTLKNMVKSTMTTLTQDTAVNQGAKVKKTKNTRKDNSTTIMLLGLCVIYFFGNLIDSSAILLDIFGIDVYYKYGFIVLIDKMKQKETLF